MLKEVVPIAISRGGTCRNEGTITILIHQERDSHARQATLLEATLDAIAVPIMPDQIADMLRAKGEVAKVDTGDARTTNSSASTTVTHTTGATLVRIATL